MRAACCPQCCVKDPRARCAQRTGWLRSHACPRGGTGIAPCGRRVAHLAGEGEKSGNQMLLMKSARLSNELNSILSMKTISSDNLLI